MIGRPATTEEIDFEITLQEGTVLFEDGDPIETTENDVVFDRHTESTVDNYFDVMLEISAAPEKQIGETRISVGNNGSVSGNRVSRASDGDDVIKVAMPWLAKSVPVTFHREGGQVSDEFIRFIDGSLAKECSNSVDDAISIGGDLELFSVANGTTFTRNPSCWLAGINFTGASPWNNPSSYLKAGTAITSRHIVYAKHYTLGVGATVYFVTEDNQIVTRTISAEFSLAGVPTAVDTTIAILDSDLPASITPFRLFPANMRDYLPTIRFGLPLVRLNHNEQVLTIDWVYDSESSLPPARRAAVTVPLTATRLGYYLPIVGGDSGNPMFILVNREAILFTHASTTGSGSMYHSFLDQIQDAIDTLGGGHSIQTIDLSSFTDFS